MTAAAMNKNRSFDFYWRINILREDQAHWFPAVLDAHWDFGSSWMIMWPPNETELTGSYAPARLSQQQCARDFKWIESFSAAGARPSKLIANMFLPKNEYDSHWISQQSRQIERSNITLFSWSSFIFLNSRVHLCFSHACDMGFLPIIIAARWCS